MSSEEVIRTIQEKIKPKYYDDEMEINKAIQFVKQYPNDFLQQNIPQEFAYHWAHQVGDRDIMIKYIKNSVFAYRWAINIGDKNIMRDRITESEWAYKWARDIGDREIMIDKIKSSKWAYFWALDIGDKEIMRDRITESEWRSEWKKKYYRQRQYKGNVF